MKEMQDRIEAMRKEMAKIRKEKEVLEIKSCIQEQSTGGEVAALWSDHIK